MPRHTKKAFALPATSEADVFNTIPALPAPRPQRKTRSKRVALSIAAAASAQESGSRGGPKTPQRGDGIAGAFARQAYAAVAEEVKIAVSTAMSGSTAIATPDRSTQASPKRNRRHRQLAQPQTLHLDWETLLRIPEPSVSPLPQPRQLTPRKRKTTEGDGNARAAANQTHAEKRQRRWMSWRAIAPRLGIALQQFRSARLQGTVPLLPDSIGKVRPCCENPRLEKREIELLDFADVRRVEIYRCRKESCDPRLHTLLLECGWFVCSPQRPRLAISVHVLEFFIAQNLRRCQSVTAWCAGTAATLRLQGHSLQDQRPFERQFPEAALWFEAIARLQHQQVQALVAENATTAGNIASSWLRELCPLCFGRSTWGGHPETNADVHVCIDAQFGHRQLLRIRSDPEIIPTQFFLSDAEVKAAAAHVQQCRVGSTAAAAAPRSSASAEVFDLCEESFKAADEDRRRCQAKDYRVHGIIGVVCRHDVPLFVANLTDTGERHHYTVALLRKLATHLPMNATLGVLYDIGCQLHRAFNTHRYLPELDGRITWATSVLHAYGHQWGCQLQYHPRKREGFGLTNGEGCERVWSWLSDLIPAERVMAPNKRIFTLDGRLQHICTQHRLRMGSWLKRQLRHVKELEEEATEVLAKTAYTIPTLRELWRDQRKTQSTMRTWLKSLSRHHSERLSEIGDDYGKILQEVKEAATQLSQTYDRYLQHSRPPDNALLAQVQQHLQLVQRIEEQRPQVQALVKQLGLVRIMEQIEGSIQRSDMPYIAALSQCIMLKQVLVQKLVHRNFEYDIINRHRRGHQETGPRKAHLGITGLSKVEAKIARRDGSCRTAIQRYNNAVAALHQVAPRPAWVTAANLPTVLPSSMSLDTDVDSPLWYMLWSDMEGSPPPPWFADEEVRHAIQMMLQRDRCHEERLRLQQEQHHVHVWLQERLSAVLKASSVTDNTLYRQALAIYTGELMGLYDSFPSGDDWEVLLLPDTLTTAPTAFASDAFVRAQEAAEEPDVEADISTVIAEFRAEQGLRSQLLQANSDSEAEGSPTFISDDEVGSDTESTVDSLAL